ncbi:MAG: hemerythrin domain-containing protein [Archangium sp.]|nr:hemerythrin domain-containing protein [Archangium sp.]
MRDIIHTLEQQHRALEKEVAMLEGALAAKSARGVRSALDKLEGMLTVHFTLEQKEFYPPFLQRVEQADPEANKLVLLFHQNLERIALGVLAFFRRWNGELEPARLSELNGEWKTTLKVLSGRLRDEEKVLHPIYVRLFGAPPTS